VVFFEDHIERTVLESLHLLPYETGLPEKYRPTRLSLDEEGILRDYVRPYFEQRSSGLRKTDIVEIQGVKFKIMAMKPDPGDQVGGGVAKDTVLSCKGVALKESFAPASRAKGKAKAKAAAAQGSSGGGGGGGPTGGAQEESKCAIS